MVIDIQMQIVSIYNLLADQQFMNFQILFYFYLIALIYVNELIFITLNDQIIYFYSLALKSLKVIFILIVQLLNFYFLPLKLLKLYHLASLIIPNDYQQAISLMFIPLIYYFSNYYYFIYILIIILMILNQLIQLEKVFTI